MNIGCLIWKHECVSCSDETGFWGECVHCHKRFGFVAREKMGRIIDRQIRERLIKLNEPEPNSKVTS